MAIGDVLGRMEHDDILLGVIAMQPEGTHFSSEDVAYGFRHAAASYPHLYSRLRAIADSEMPRPFMNNHMRDEITRRLHDRYGQNALERVRTVAGEMWQAVEGRREYYKQILTRAIKAYYSGDGKGHAMAILEIGALSPGYMEEACAIIDALTFPRHQSTSAE